MCERIANTRRAFSPIYRSSDIAMYVYMHPPTVIIYFAKIVIFIRTMIKFDESGASVHWKDKHDNFHYYYTYMMCVKLSRSRSLVVLNLLFQP